MPPQSLCRSLALQDILRKAVTPVLEVWGALEKALAEAAAAAKHHEAACFTLLAVSCCVRPSSICKGRTLFAHATVSRSFFQQHHIYKGLLNVHLPLSIQALSFTPLACHADIINTPGVLPTMSLHWPCFLTIMRPRYSQSRR